jgi:hypothetical protein
MITWTVKLEGGPLDGEVVQMSPCRRYERRRFGSDGVLSVVAYDVVTEPGTEPMRAVYRGLTHTIPMSLEGVSP